MPLPAIIGAIGEIGFAMQAVHGVAGKVTGLGAAAVKVVSPVNTMNVAVGAIGNVAGSVASQFTAITESMGQFVKYSNPALAKLGELASADLFASIGRAVEPIMKFGIAVTGLGRDIAFKLSGPLSKAFASLFGPLEARLPKIADALAPLLRVGGKVAEMFGAIFGEFGKAETFEKLQTVFEKLEDVLTPVIDGVVALTGVMGTLFEHVQTKWIGGMMRLLGFDPNARPKTFEKISEGGVGAAVRSVNIGSVESFQQKAWQQAFALGKGASPELQTANNTLDIYRWLQQYGVPAFRALEQIPANIEAAIRTLIAAIPGPRAAAAAVGNASEWAAGQGRRIEEEARKRARDVRGFLGAG